MLKQGSKQYDITTFRLHTSATPAAWGVGKTAIQMRDEIRHWHMNPGAGKTPWSDIGYHLVCGPKGDYAMGRPLDRVPAGVAGHNPGNIDVCLVPSAWVDRIGTFEDFYTEAQKQTVLGLIQGFRIMIPTLKRVTGHNDYTDAKTCPGFRVQQTPWLMEAMK